jgi:hypothetical protein
MTAVTNLSNGELYSEWNSLVWLLQRGYRLTPAQKARMDEIEIEASSRPAE